MNTYVTRDARAPFQTLLVALVAAVLLALAFSPGCNSVGQSGLPVYASMNVYDPGGAQLVGTVRTDTKRFIAWGIANADAGVFLKQNGFPVMGPFRWQDRKAIFYDLSTDPKIEWEGDLGAPLPSQSRVLFSDAEILAYSIQFEPES